MGLVQYIILRKDLVKAWPLGALMAQACHATCKMLAEFSNDPEVQKYISPEEIDEMTKVVLEIENETELRKFSAALTELKILHSLWVEQPENQATAIAVKPYNRDSVKKHFSSLKMLS